MHGLGMPPKISIIRSSQVWISTVPWNASVKNVVSAGQVSVWGEVQFNMKRTGERWNQEGKRGVLGRRKEGGVGCLLLLSVRRVDDNSWSSQCAHLCVYKLVHGRIDKYVNQTGLNLQIWATVLWAYLDACQNKAGVGLKGLTVDD